MFYPDLSGKNIRLMVRYLMTAKETLDIAVFALTNNKLRNTIFDLHYNHKIKVRILADDK